MKKLFLTLAITLLSMTAMQAQLVIGGSLGMGGEIGNKTVVDGKITGIGNNTFNFTFVPRIGVRLISDKLEVGAALRFQYNETMSYVIKSDQKSVERDLKDPDFVMYVSPYARYLFLNKNWFNLGVEGIVDLGWGIAMANKQFETGYISAKTADAYNQSEKDAIKETKPGDFRWGVNIRPVMVFNLTDHWMMDITLDALGFSATGQVESAMVPGLSGKTKATTSHAAIQLNVMNPDTQFFTLGCAYKF